MPIPKGYNSALDVFKGEIHVNCHKPNSHIEISELYRKGVENVIEGQEVIGPQDSSLKSITKEAFFELMLSPRRGVIYSKPAINYLISKFSKGLSKSESRYLRAAGYYYIKRDKISSEIEYENEKYLIYDRSIYSIVFKDDYIIFATNEDFKKSISTKSLFIFNGGNSLKLFDFQIKNIENPFYTIYKIIDTEDNIYFFDISSNKVTQIGNTNGVFDLEQYDNDIYHYINESGNAVVKHIFHDKIFDRGRIEKLDKRLALLIDKSTGLYDLYSFDSKNFLFEGLKNEDFEKKGDTYSWKLKKERKTLLGRFFLGSKIIIEKASR